MSRPLKLKVTGTAYCRFSNSPTWGYPRLFAGAYRRCLERSEMEATMTSCDELVGKTIRSCSLYEDGPYGPEILIEFTDNTVFNTCLKTSATLEAKLLRKSADEAELLKDFSPAV